AQWRHLQRTLGTNYSLVAPDLRRLDASNSQLVAENLTLEQEVELLLELVDRGSGKFHVVGHSYGGAVALRLALTRSDRVASLVLYEPSAFSLLHGMGQYGRLAAQEIQTLATRVSDLVGNGFSQRAAEQFVRYWGDDSTWATLRPDQQQELTQQMALVVQHFHALQESSMCLEDLQNLPMPTLVLRGGCSPTPSRLIACHLLAHLSDVKGACFSEAGHMGPVTHADKVAHRMARFIDACEEDGHSARIEATGDAAA
ncbi:MAG: alpha/beta hydrolase, partial [Pseudomonadota bacterium]